MLTVKLLVGAPQIDIGIYSLVKIGERAVVRSVRHCLTDIALEGLRYVPIEDKPMLLIEDDLDIEVIKK